MYIHKGLINFCAVYLTVIAATGIQDVCAQNGETFAGPLRFYQDLGCEPKYRDDNTTIYAYYCESIQKRNSTKCYLHGQSYNIGESVWSTFNGIRQKCQCLRTCRHAKASFRCPPTRCPYRPPRLGYYRQRNITEFCPGPEIHMRPQDRYKCRVNDLVYTDGSYFRPSEPDTECYCGPGYKGINVPPYCLRVSVNPCKTELFHSAAVARGCVPVFEMYQAPDLECPEFFACPHVTDQIMAERFDQMPYENVRCRFGNLRMQYGQVLTLHRNKRFGGCIRCYCSMGPLPTCLRFPPAICPLFSERSR